MRGYVLSLPSDGEYPVDKMREKGLTLEDVGNACVLFHVSTKRQ